MPAKRALSAALALLLVAAIPARATSVPTLTVIDTINPGVGSSYAMDLSQSVALSGYLYFAADDATHGRELWRTDGTTTALVMDINTANSGADSSSPYALTALNGYLYFSAYDGTHGWELRRTNGTTTARSPQITLGADPGNLVFNASFSYGATATSADWFRVWVEAEDGTRTLVHQRLAASRYRYAAFTQVRVSLTAWANQVVRVVIGAGDVGQASLVEVAVDDVRIERR